eukprot:4085604-Amphidinium_carterae.1
MAWENPKVAQLINSLKALGVGPGTSNRRGGERRYQQSAQIGSKKWFAQTRTSWNCPHCKYFNFGFRTSCFLCKVGQELPAQTKKGPAPGQKPLPS